MITIVNYGMGNLGSMVNMFKRIGVKANIEAEPEVIGRAEKLLLPGVGAFDSAMTCINSVPRLREVLDHKALVERVPILGVCLGMQLLTRSSEEGALPGLGWIPGVTSRFPKQEGLKVPHMGWNVVSVPQANPLLPACTEEQRFYFVHSYKVVPDDPTISIGTANHGGEFCAAFQQGNVFGVQFHPEKSHRFGMELMRRFVEL